MKKNLLKRAAMVALMLVAMASGFAQNIPITLNQGWNWISYPYSEPMSITEALSGFTPSNGDMIKSKSNGTCTYRNGIWVGQLKTFIPGQGYHYQSVDGTTRSFIFGGAAYDPSALPEEALDGEFTVDANGTKVRFSPGNLQCRIDPNQESQITLGTGTSTTAYMPYHTFYNYSLCQMIYKAEELRAAGLKAGPITGIAFESYSTNHYLRTGIKIWMAATTLTAAPTTSVSTSGMTQVFNGSVTQLTGWTEIPFNSGLFTWDGTSNLMVTVVMNHGSYISSTYWQCSSTGFTCCNYKYRDNESYDPSSSTYSMSTSSNRPNTRFNGRGGVVWRFADRQMDYIGEGNANISDTYTGLIDLFGWGTSGHPHGAVCYQPWSTSTTDADYYAYGDASYNLNDQSGLADWGCNAISNGGDEPNQWRTLTKEEWKYLLNTRTTSSGKRYAKAKVGEVNGVILLPDDWKTSYYSLNSTNSNTAAFTANTITSAQWGTLEQHGAVFLPAAGTRNGTTVNYVGSYGYYWSISSSGSSYAYQLSISPTDLYAEGLINRCRGRSVRLVCQTNPRIRTLGMTNVTLNSATANAEVDYTGSATVTERGVCWNTTVAPTVNNSIQAAGSGTGGFTAQLADLSAGTTYHVRAYALIDGTYRYGNELTITTATQPSVYTAPVTDISGTYALCGGTVSECGQNVTARGLCWGTSSNPTVDSSHSYDGTGTGSFTGIMTGLTVGTTYYVRAYATTAAGTVYGSTRSFTPVAHEYVDLGLPSGLLWATCNVGATAPEEYGDYFAWGETTPKDTYDWSTYQYADDVYVIKYTVIDGLTTLLPEDDAATANWGSDWRMPTQAEFQELLDNTTVTWATLNGVNGQIFTASNGNSLFLPAAGYRMYDELNDVGYFGSYWSSSLSTVSPIYAWLFYFLSDYYGMNGDYGRFYGQSVRPVRSASQN